MENTRLGVVVRLTLQTLSFEEMGTEPEEEFDLGGTRAYVQQLLMEARTEVLHADSKASIVLAGLGVGIGALLGGLLANAWSPSDLTNGVEWLWWLGAVNLAVSLGASAASVWPRFKSRKQPAAIFYWGDLKGVDGLDSLKRLLGARPPDEAERALDQFFTLSQIVITKYTLVRLALILAGSGALLCVTAVILDASLG